MKNLKAKRNERKKKDLREAKEYKIRISPPPKKREILKAILQENFPKIEKKTDSKLHVEGQSVPTQR